MTTPKIPFSIEYGLLPYTDLPNIVLLMCKDSRDKKWKPIGTAFPVFHNNVVTLVTAEHVVRNTHGLPVKAINYPYEVSLERSQVLSMGNLDVACIQCDSEDLAKLFKICHCVVPAENFISVGNMETTICQVFGYPQSKNAYSPNKSFIPNAIRLTLGQQQTYSPNSIPSKPDIPLLQFDLNGKALVNNEFQKTNQLSVFKGMSGGPVINYSTITGLGYLLVYLLNGIKHQRRPECYLGM